MSTKVHDVRILHYVQNHPGVMVGQLAVALNIGSKSHMGILVKSLVERGLLQRCGDDRHAGYGYIIPPEPDEAPVYTRREQRTMGYLRENPGASVDQITIAFDANESAVVECIATLIRRGAVVKHEGAHDRYGSRHTYSLAPKEPNPDE